MSEISLSRIPAEPIHRQLAALIQGGMSADDAAAKVIAPYRPAPLADYVWPAVRNEAHGLHREHHRQIEDRALGEAGVRARQAARVKLPVSTFRLGDGKEVEWGKATTVQHMARIAWQNTQIDAIKLDIARHERAVELIRAHGVDCLDEIDGWVDLLADSASAPVEGSPRVTARKAATSAKPRKQPAVKPTLGRSRGRSGDRSHAATK